MQDSIKIIYKICIGITRLQINAGTISYQPSGNYHYYYFNGPSPASFSFIFGFFSNKLQLLQTINGIDIHPVYGAGIRTHDLLNMSRLP